MCKIIIFKAIHYISFYMKGNIGLTQDIIHNEINIKCTSQTLWVPIDKITSYATESYQKYTEIAPHKELYEATISEKNNVFHYNFILKNDTNKFLILKELYLMSDDLTVDEFYPLITKMVHMVKDKFVLNSLDGESLKTINLFLKYDNKYCMSIPIYSSYSIMNSFENDLVVEIETSKKIKLKLLGIFNHVVSSYEIKQFDGRLHEYLNTSFKLHKFNINKEMSSVSITNNSENAFYRSIIVIVENKFKNTKMFLKTLKFDTHINLLNTPHKKIGDKIAFLITNTYDEHKEFLINYQYQGIINTNSIEILFSNVLEKFEIIVILQQFNVIQIFL